MDEKGQEDNTNHQSDYGFTDSSHMKNNLNNSKQFKKPVVSLNLILSILILLSILIAAFFYWQNNRLKSMLADKLSEEQPQTTQTPSSQTINGDYEDWETYTSPTFGYSFKYPKTWSILMFKEDDPDILFGSNSLQNYSPTEVEKFMNHGLINWKDYIKEKPAIKIDFAVYSKKPGTNQFQEKNEFLNNLLNESAKKIDVSDLTIGNQPTEQYKAIENLGPTDVPEINTFISYPDENRIIYMNLSFWNINSYELLKKTQEWQEFSQILSTYKFNE